MTERNPKRNLLESKNPGKNEVNWITSKPLIVGKLTMDIKDTVKLMFKRKIKKLPAAHDDQLIGLVTLIDRVSTE